MLIAILSALVVAADAPEGDPIERAYLLFRNGDLDQARALVAPLLTRADAIPAASVARARYLELQMLLAAGEPAEALRLLDREKAALAAAAPWTTLFAAEAAIRAGSPASAVAGLRSALAAYGKNRTFEERCLHLLLMAELGSQPPDEPTGLSPTADLGSALAARLGFSPANDAKQAEPEQSNGERKRSRLLRERLPCAPMLTLAGAAHDRDDRGRRSCILLALLAPEHAAAGGMVERDLLPLADRYGPRGRLTLALIMSAPTAHEVRTAVQAIRTLDRRGDTLILWTLRPDAFLSYGIRRTPFFLLVNHDPERRAVIDWEPPWGNHALFVRRVRDRLESPSALPPAR